MTLTETLKVIKAMQSHCVSVDIQVDTDLVIPPDMYRYRFVVNGQPANESLIGGKFTNRWLAQAEADEFLRVFAIGMTARAVAEGEYQLRHLKAVGKL